MSDNDALVRERYLSDRFEWAAPGDQQEDAWLLRFCDNDVRDLIWTGEDAEQEAWAAWNLHAPGYNCYLFRLAALRSTPQAKSLDPPAQDEVEVLAATIFEADPDVGTTWDEWVAYANEPPDHLQSVEYVRRLATAAIAALDRHPAGDDALREENARLRGALRDASVSLWWAARQMKGNCNGGAVDAVNLAAEDASSVAALTGRQG